MISDYLNTSDKNFIVGESVIPWFPSCEGLATMTMPSVNSFKPYTTTIHDILLGKNGSFLLPKIPDLDYELVARHFGNLAGITVAILGAGAIGLHTAKVFSEAGAQVEVFSDRKTLCAMGSAVGILEPQGADVESYWLNSQPLLDYFITQGAPIRRDRTTYLYRNQQSVDFGHYEELLRMPDSKVQLSKSSYADFEAALSFDAYILNPSAYRDFLISDLCANGVVFREEHIQSDLARKDFDLTISALGLGKRDMVTAKVHIPGNRGQIIRIPGQWLAPGVGSIGIPDPAGSVNIIQQYWDPLTCSNPYVLVGATKKPGSSMPIPNEEDYRFLLDGIRLLHPALWERLTADSAAQLYHETYVCVRPGGGETSFHVGFNQQSGSIEAYAAGGMGNSIAPAAAIHIFSKALQSLAEGDFA